MNAFYNLRESYVCTSHDFTYMLLSVAVQDNELTVQNVEIKNNPVNLTAFSY